MQSLTAGKRDFLSPNWAVFVTNLFHREDKAVLFEGKKLKQIICNL